MTAELFTIAPALRPKRTPDQRRAARQIEAIRGGAHPLSAALGKHIPLHPHANRDATPGGETVGPTCGTCRLRSKTTYPKCRFGVPKGESTSVAPRATRGAGTDVRAWWPACRDYFGPGGGS